MALKAIQETIRLSSLLANNYGKSAVQLFRYDLETSPFLCQSCRAVQTMRFKPAITEEDQEIDDPLLKDLSGRKVPVIKLPKALSQKMAKAVEKKLAKEDEQRKEALENYKKPLLIACKRQQLNYRVGQSHGKFEPIRLASQKWAKRESNGDFFVIKALKDNPAFGFGMPTSSFRDFELHPEMHKRISELNLSQCSVIQNLAIPAIQGQDNVILAAETGSGKTYAYLVPLLDRVLRDKEQEQKDGTIRMSEPRLLILVPSRELAEQVEKMIKSLVPEGFLDIETLIGGERTQLKLRTAGPHSVDVLIATPGVLSKFLTNRLYSLGQLDAVVIDEADSLLDDSFSDKVKRILLKSCLQGSVQAEGILQATQDYSGRIGAQVILAGATLPKGLDDALDGILSIDSFKKVTSAYLQKMMPHVRQEFHRISQPAKQELIIELIREDMKKGISTMVFTNDTPTCDWLTRYLAENGCPNLNLNGKMPMKYRRGRFEHFRDGNMSVLVCTDIASRGLDTTFVEHVINYEFPLFVSDYIHRCGRVGRIGSSPDCYVTSLVSSAEEVPTVHRVEEAARKTVEFHNVNANITRKINARFGLEAGDLDKKNQLKL